MTIRILLVDDHPIVRQGLKTLLEGHSGWEVIGEASDGAEAVEKAKDLESRRHGSGCNHAQNERSGGLSPFATTIAGIRDIVCHTA